MISFAIMLSLNIKYGFVYSTVAHLYVLGLDGYTLT